MSTETSSAENSTADDEETVITAITTGPLADRVWRADWIGAHADNSFSLGFGAPENREFRRTLFRATIQLDAVPAEAPARLTADSRYALFINGAEVGRGPVRSQPRRQRYDSYDLAPFLDTGTNVIAVLVTYYGEPTSFWQPAATSGGLGEWAVLAFEAQLGDDWLLSDESWRVHESDAWTTGERSGLDGVPVEILDARELPADWKDAGFDDASWPKASIARATHVGGFGRSKPPTEPYGALLPRPVAQLGGDVVTPATILLSHANAPTDLSAHPVARVGATLRGQGDAAADAVSLPVAIDADGETAALVTIDFGRVVAGYVSFEIEAPAGTVVDVMYRERMFEPSVPGDPTSMNTGVRYVARGHDDRFDTNEVNGFRYAYLLISSDAGRAARLTDFRIAERLHAVSPGARFESDDPEIDALYRAGIRTVQLNAHDSYIDCPTREQRAWVGDGVVHQMVHLTTNADWRLPQFYVDLGNSPRPDGILPMSVVGEIESSGGLTIPDWSLHWVHGVHNLYRYLGSAVELQALLPTVERILRWYLPYVDEHGTLADVTEWNLVDWSSVHVTGRSSILTSLWARGLREFAEMSEFVGNPGAASWARAHFDAAAAGFEDFWDESRGTYLDHILDGERRPAASQAAGATAVVSGLAPRDRWKRIVATITDPDTVVVRSWIGSDDGGYDDAKMLEQARGVQRIDWDAEREIVLAEPFYSYVVHDAVAHAGEAGSLVTLMRRWSQFLVDGYDTFGECWGWGTPVHGWSSTPTRDLVMYVLGVTPAEPGFTAVRVQPDLGPLGRASGTVPTPAGWVSVAVTEGGVNITSPVPVVYVDSAGTETRLERGTHSLAR